MFSQAQPVDGQGAIITFFEVDRVAVRPDELVTVYWRASNAGSIRITLPDGYSVVLDASPGAGSHEFTATAGGVIEATAYGWTGPPARASRMIGFYAEPEQVLVPIPDLRDAPMPVFGRTTLPIVDRSPLFAALLIATPPRLHHPPWAAVPRSAAPIGSAPQVRRPRQHSWLSLGDRIFRPINLLVLFLDHLTSRHRPPRWLIRRQHRGG